MKQYRPLINRIIKKIPENQLETLVAYLTTTFSKAASAEVLPFMSMIMKERNEYADALLKQDNPNIVRAGKISNETTTEENTLPM